MDRRGFFGTLVGLALSASITQTAPNKIRERSLLKAPPVSNEPVCWLLVPLGVVRYVMNRDTGTIKAFVGPQSYILAHNEFILKPMGKEKE